MNSKEKGNIGHLAVSKKLTQLGLPVFTEIGDSSKVDLITIVNRKPIRIQVKYITPVKDRITVSLTKAGPNYRFKYDDEDFDVFAIYVPITDSVFFIPLKLISKVNEKSFTLRLKPARNNQKKNVHLASDYQDLTV